MSSQLLVTDVTVTLAAGASTTVAHGLTYAGHAAAPNRVFPDRPTAVGVTATTSTTVSFKNFGSSSDTVTFQVALDHSVLRDPQSALGFQIWKGGAGGISKNVRTPSRGLAEKIIYARPTGNDVTGDGTLALPFATWSRALAELEHVYWNGPVTIDGTGVTEVVTTPLVIPPVHATMMAQLNFAATHQFDAFRFGLNLVAYPITLATIPAVGSVMTIDPDDQLVSITVAPNPGWIVNAYKGKLILGNNLAEWGRVISNTSDTVVVARAGSWGMTSPCTICEESAEIHFTPAGWPTTTVVVNNVGSSVSIQGLKLTNTPGAGRGIEVSCEAFVLGCTIDGAILQAYTGNYPVFDACYWPQGNAILFNGAAVDLKNSYFKGITFEQYASNGQCQYCGNMVEGCSPWGHGGNSEVNIPYQIESNRIVNATSHGICYNGGSRCSVRYCSINGSVGDAVNCAGGGGGMELIDVVGAGNGGVGCRATTGAQVLGTVGTTVTGTGGDIVAGVNAPAAWVGLVNETSLAHFARIYR
jgi:hypothetical protein